MATQTQHFNLTKPDWEDRASISVLNANTDIIDAQMYDNEQSAANAIGNMAAEYDDTATYSVGDFCIYSEVLYKCTTAVTVAEAFDATKWTQTTAAENFGSGGGGSATLAGLTDVNLTSPTDGQALVYDATNQEWVNGAGGGGGIDYSTTEQDTGLKWIDGKPIYERTITGNISGTAYTDITPAGWTDISEIVKMFGVCTTSNGATNAIGTYRPNTDWYSWFMASPSSVAHQVGSSFMGGKYAVTLQYTKTTD